LASFSLIQLPANDLVGQLVALFPFQLAVSGTAVCSPKRAKTNVEERVEKFAHLA
jgi:hypothetical protein|tara:strand:- start:371 stop:535 length:165 start_codon:yes stop_codon:yes gene_type:complete